MSSYLLECIDCQKHYVPADVEYVCPACSVGQKKMDTLDGVLRCIYDYEAVAKHFNLEVLAGRSEQGLARWIELLPLKSAQLLPPLITAASPLRRADGLRSELKMSALWLKDDSVQPTGSLKDRPSALIIACARERERHVVATASTGNAATALAGQAASVGMKSVIFAPASAPPAKLAQIAVYGGTLIPIKGTYDEAFDLSIEACERFGWYNRSTTYNPFTIEGKKTAGLEIWEQLGFKSPDWIIVPTGDGAILAGMEKAFADLKAMNLVDRVPKLAAVQAAGCSPIVSAWNNGHSKITPELKPKTVADSIAVGIPRAGHWALKALTTNGGVAVAVEDEEILEAIPLLGRTTGIFAEPAAATSIAGLKRLVVNGTIKGDDVVVALITGNGLKDVPAASRTVVIPRAIEPEIDAVAEVIGRL